MKTHLVTTLLSSILLLLAVLPANAQSTNADFQQAVADYQKSPNQAAAEKVIGLAREMNPPPAIPEEARRHYVKARTLLDDAKQPSESADAAEEFRQALLLAPWWGEAYMRMGQALEVAQRYDAAIVSLKLFMATKPQDDVLRMTQDEIYKIEAKAEKAAKDKELAAKSATEKAAQDAQLAAERKEKEKEKGRDGRFMAYKDGTVLDSETKLMWAAEDDGGRGISWSNGKRYCENYRAGGYADWRMPTLDELETLYDATKSRPNPNYPSSQIHVATTLIILSGPWEWAADPRSDRMYDPSDRQWHFQANFFEFGATTRSQTRSFTFTEGYASNRVIPVRSVK